jgi:pimeloyl-ACP methyl ester carboxylesterase
LWRLNRTINRKNRTQRVRIIDDAGHMVHEEKPDAVNRAIASFLDPSRW